MQVRGAMIPLFWDQVGITKGRLTVSRLLTIVKKVVDLVRI